MELPVTIEVWQKGDYYVAKCPELDFISQGGTPDEAKRHLFEVIGIQFEEMTAMGTLEDYLAECGYVRHESTFVPQVEIISLEQHAIQVA